MCRRGAGDLVVSLHTIQSFGTRKAVHVGFRALPESCHERAEILVPVEIHGIKGGSAEEDLDDLCVLILASFVPDLLESFSEIMVVCDRMTFLVRRE